MRDTLRVAGRILAQLGRDLRFLVLSGAVPLLLVLLLKYVFGVIPMMRGVHIDAYALPSAAFFIFFITYILSTVVLVRERRDGTLSRMFAAGYRRASVVLGYVIGYSAIAALQTVLVVVATVLAFHLSVDGRIWAVAGTTMALSVVSLAFGVFLSTLARSEGQIIPTIPLIIIPSILLSGLVIPHASLAGWMRAVSYVIPLTYAESVLLGVMRDGKAFAEVALSFLALLGYGAGLLAVASLTVRETD
jgi:ABC-2 type transport system permease protein